MTALRQTYRDQIVGIMDRLLSTESAAWDATVAAIAATLRAGRLVYVAGSGHSHLLALEVFYRAGGIAAAQAVLDEDLMLHRGAERSTQLERDPGRATAVLEAAGLAPGDVLVIASNSGRNAYPIELAIEANAAGATVIALTSLRHSQAVTSRHSSGKRLFELSDIVLDNGGVEGDAGLVVPGHPAPMGPTSTIIGVWMLNSILAEAVALLAQEGVVVDVWQSANAASGDNSAALIAKWRARVQGL
ncbi:MAG: SIS domain-containing protein [Alphaproteobacteria bacterium]|jgi:uncharacterized phosphosugar-binding protein